MEESKMQRLLRAIDRATAAATALVISTAQYDEEAQTVTGATMTLIRTPTFVFGVYLNGQRLTKTTDYTVAANVVTFVSFTPAADYITVVFKY